MSFRSLAGTAVLAGLVCAGLADAQVRKVKVASYSRMGATWGPVPGASLEFTPANASETWILLLSGKLSNSSSAGRSAELRYLVNGVERGMGGANNNPVNYPDGWHHFDRVTGTTATQSVRVEIQSLNAGATATVTDLQIVVFRLPQGADFQFVEWQAPPDPDPVVVPNTFTTMAPALTFTPSSAGDYLVVATATGHEDPGSSFIGMRLRDPAGTAWPVDHDLPDSRRGHFLHGRSAYRTFFWARIQNLDASSKTYAIEATGDVGGPNAEMRYHRIMAFRTDAFETVESVESLADELAPATTPTVKGVVTTAAPPGPRDYVILQSIGLHAPGSATESRNAGFEANDVVQMSATKVHDVPELDLSYALFDVRTTASSVKYENTYWTSNLAHNVFAKESVIHVLRLPTCSPVVNLRSIGTSAANLHPVGTASVSVNSTIVTFSSPLPASTAVGAVGPGDRLLIEGETLFIKTLDSPTQVTLQSPALADHVAVTTPSFTITRAHSGATPLSGWETARGGDLVAENRREVGVVYKDSPILQTLTINGSTTDSCRFLWLMAAPGQRHTGVKDTGALLDGESVRNGIIVSDDYTRIEGLDFKDHRAGGESAIRVQSATNVLLSGLIVRNANMAIKGESGTQFTIRNSILYNSTEAIHDEGATVLIENCTVYGITLSDGAIKGTNFTVKNTISMGNVGQDFKDMPLANLSYCISEDNSANCATCRRNRTPTDVPTASPNFVVFSSLAGGSEDLHLQTSTVNDAVDFATDLAPAFFDDIDGALRPAGSWDVGADELGAATAVTLVRFEATGLPGEVLLAWETASELRNLGFHVHRATSTKGVYERITQAVIPGLGSSPHGARYLYRDLGLEDGVSYFYRLEDIETTGRSTFHGPLAATPGSESKAPQSLPPSSKTATSFITFGDPSRNSYSVMERGPSGAVVELRTEGFFAQPQDDGTVVLIVPGFESLSRANGPSLPVTRPWIDAREGRGVEVVSVRAAPVEVIDGLVPAGGEIIDVVASPVGTVRMRRGAARAHRKGAAIFPEESARLLAVGHQGDEKLAQLELAPLRWDGSNGRLLLSRRLVVQIAFRGRDDSASRRTSRRERGAGRRVAARLATTEPGVHELRFEELGFARSLALDRLRLSRQGESTPFHVLPSKPSFGPGSRLYFVSEGAGANPHGNEAVYELEVSGGGTAMKRMDARPHGGSAESFVQEDAYEEDRYYQASLLEAPDLWLWDVLLAPVSKTFPFQTRSLALGRDPSRLVIRLQGVSDLDAQPDHHVRVLVNGTALGDLYWDGKASRRAELEIPPGILAEGDNALTLENVGDTGAAYSMVMLDRFEVSYQRRPTPDAGALRGLYRDSGVASISGFSPAPVHVVDVTEDPRWLEGSERSGDGTIRFRVDAGRRYLAVSADAVHRPEIRSSRPPKLGRKEQGVDYLVLGPREFADEAAPLLLHRERQGLRVEFAAIEDVYEEFGFGETTPEAAKKFLEHVYRRRREPRLKYVLLLGDATYDFKNRLGTGVLNRVPPLMVRTSYLWTVSDPALAAVNGDDLLPDVAIGRLPAANGDELRTLVGKILAYENGGANLSHALVLAADDPDDAGDFPENAREIAEQVLSGRDVRLLSLEELGSRMRGEVLSAFDEGASLFGYVGHGGIHLWADENVFNIADVPNLHAQPQQPLFVTMNCLNGYFHFPYFDSLAEALVKVEGRGAIAAFSPSGLSLNEPAHLFHRALLDAVFRQGHKRLGDAVLAAQSEYARTGAFPELLAIYHLLGDPALSIR